MNEKIKKWWNNFSKDLMAKIVAFALLTLFTFGVMYAMCEIFNFVLDLIN